MLSADVRTALELWLQYAEARRTLTARLYDQRQDQAAVRQLLDENDALLDRARTLTERLLANDGGGGGDRAAG